MKELKPLKPSQIKALHLLGFLYLGIDKGNYLLERISSKKATWNCISIKYYSKLKKWKAYKDLSYWEHLTYEDGGPATYHTVEIKWIKLPDYLVAKFNQIVFPKEYPIKRYYAGYGVISNGFQYMNYLAKEFDFYNNYDTYSKKFEKERVKTEIEAAELAKTKQQKIADIKKTYPGRYEKAIAIQEAAKAKREAKEAEEWEQRKWKFGL